MKQPTIPLCAALSAALLFTSCSLFGDGGQSAVRAYVQQRYDAGAITAEQRDTELASIHGSYGSGFDWTALLNVLVLAAGSLVGGPLVVRALRGPPTQKVGLSASKIITHS